MLIHKWRDSDISQMPEVGQLGKYSIPKGYVNATQMCHANNSTKGRKASALCRKQGIEIERIHDPRFGKVGLYPETILVEVFKAEQN